MRTVLAAAAAAVVCRASTTTLKDAKLVFNQSEDAAVYTSVGVSAYSGKSTVTVADWLNRPIFVGAYNGSTGNQIWQFLGSDQSKSEFQVTQARHAEAAGGIGSVDTIALQISMAGETSGCQLYAFATTGGAATGNPAWNVSVPDCTANVATGSMYEMVTFSSSGALAVFTGYIGASNTPTVWGFNGQTGAQLWSYTPPAGTKAGNIGVHVSEDGSFVAFTNSPFTYILNGADGSLRGAPIPSEFAGYVSDTGNYVATVGASSAFVYSWSGSAYTVAFSVPTPVGCAAGCIYPWVVAMATDDAAVEYASFGWISGDVKQTQVTAYALSSGACVANWTSTLNTKNLQTNPTIRADGRYVAIATWGEDGAVDGVPTVIVVAANPAGTNGAASTPLFSFVTPGSMFSVDVVVTSTSATTDTLIVAAAGKSVPANQFGNGGNAFAWAITANKQ